MIIGHIMIYCVLLRLTAGGSMDDGIVIKGIKRIVANTPNRSRNINILQLLTTRKCIRTDLRNSIRNDHILHSAISERICANAIQTPGQNNVFQTTATPKSIVFDLGNAVRNHNSLQVRLAVKCISSYGCNIVRYGNIFSGAAVFGQGIHKIDLALGLGNNLAPGIFDHCTSGST